MTARNSRFDVIGQLASLRRHASSLTRSDLMLKTWCMTLFRAYEKRASFQDGRLRSWLLSILHNVFIDGRPGAAAETPAHRAGRRYGKINFLHRRKSIMRLAQARRTFVALPEEQRAALHLVAIEGLTFADAASVLDIPAGTLLSHLARARAVLRAIEDGTVETSDGTSAASRESLEVQMDDPVDPITEADLEAYVEDQFPMERRIDVEAYLGQNPPVAMRVIADLRIRDELRLALADIPRGTQRVRWTPHGGSSAVCA